MNQAHVFSPLVIAQFGLWIAVVGLSIYLLRRRRVSRWVRLGFLAGGVAVFGFPFAALLPVGSPPNPVSATRTLLTGLLVRGQLVAPMAGITLGLLLLVGLSNKSICGWGCPLGLLQDLLYQIPVRKWKPPPWASNSVRALAFLALISALLVARRDWIGSVDPFSVFTLSLAPLAGGFTGAVLFASLFVYRPWCQFLCPFGLLGWLVEQISLLRPRVDRQLCVGCKRCVTACPTQAMEGLYADKKLHGDCYACGACLAACPKKGALRWGGRR